MDEYKENENRLENQEGTEEEDNCTEQDLEQEFDQKYGQVYSQEEWTKIVEMYNGDDPVARDAAGTKAYYAMTPFIASIARRMYSSYFPRYGEDLMSEGAVGLCESLKIYDPKKGKLTTWCYRSVLHHMRAFIDREVHHTTPHYQDHIRKIRDYITKRELMGEKWTFDDIVINTGISLTTVLNCMTIEERNSHSVSLDEDYESSDSHSSSLKECIPSNSVSPEDYVVKRESLEQLYTDMKNCLTEVERMLIILNFGFFGEDPKSSKEIETITGIRKQEIRPMLNMAEYKLRKYINYKENYADEKKGHFLYGRGAVISLLKSKETLAEELDTFVFD